MLTTGLTQLHEGNTVASVDEKLCTTLSFDPVLYDHEGHLLVVVRKAQKGSGAIIIDGAFTKLYCSWETVAGSARFVRNCACFLSASFGDEGGPVVQAAAAAPEEAGAIAQGPQLNWENCFRGSCDISFEDDQPLALLACKSPAAESNTTDFVLDNALGAGPANVVAFGKQAYKFDVAKMLLLGTGKDPFRRVDIDAVIPCVSLEFPENRELVGDALCNVFFPGGLNFQQKAFFLFLAVCDKNLIDDDCERRDVWSAFEATMVRNLQSTATFTDIGPKIRLLDAMQAFVLDESCLNKTFGFLATMVRILKRQKVPVDEAAIRLLLKRSALRILMSSVISLAKKDQAGAVRERIESLLYERCNGILPVRGCAANASCLSGYNTFVANAEGLLADMSRMSKTLHQAQDAVEPLVHDKEVALVLLRLLELEDSAFIVSLKALIDRLNSTPLFTVIWNSPTVAASIKDWDAVKAAEDRLSGFAPVDVQHDGVSPFVTCFGPSVFECICGYRFGDAAVINLDDAVQVEALKKRRNQHFEEVYRSDANGYPTATSGHCSLHRAVQRVLTSAAHAKAQDATKEMEDDVLRYLRKHSKGDIFYPNILADIRKLISSYLSLRKQGFAEPANSESVDFTRRAKEEANLLKKK